MKNVVGGTLNDVVLATVAGAVRRFLERHRVRPEHLDFRVMAPVSVRAAEERGTLGNRVSAWMVPMPLDERDPRRRLERIRETTDRAQGLEAGARRRGLDGRSASGRRRPCCRSARAWPTRRLPFNLVVTNVPGPQVPLYLLSARMLDNYGLVPLTDYLCLGIVLFSYAGKLCWGFTCDWDLIPDLHDFVLDVERSFRELAELTPLEVSAEPTNGKRRQRAHAREAASSPRRRAGVHPGEPPM